MNKKLLYINGHFLYYAFIAGSKEIIENQAELNRINVFPVRDKDTGTNLASTVRCIIENIKPHNSYKTTASLIAQAAIEGARGNSGIIFAQFLYGLSNEAEDRRYIGIKDFIDNVKNALPYVYKAIANPVEGTMLTVIKEWSEYLCEKKDIIKDFRQLLVDSFSVLEQSLKETTAKLKELNKFSFVDAGAKGFVLFIKGIITSLNGEKISLPDLSHFNEINAHEEIIDEKEIIFRYCTEAVVKNLNVGTGMLHTLIKNKGDSVVIGGSPEYTRVHIHTNHPEEIFDILNEVGTVSYQKADDMVRQQEIALKRKWNIALLTDSACDLSKEIIDNYQINVLPLNITFGERQYLDKLTIRPKQFYRLAEESSVFPQSSQINVKQFINTYSQLTTNYDAVIAVHLTSKFSGTYSNSLKAAEIVKKESGKDIFVIDSHTLSGALGLLVYKAAIMIEKGKAAKEIVKELEQIKESSNIYVSVKSLKYMIRSGRVPKPAGIITDCFNITPIVSMNKDGSAALLGGTIGQKNSIKRIRKYINNRIHKNGIWNYIIMHTHNKQAADKVRNDMIHISGKEPLCIEDISPVIGMHAGKGAVAVAVI